MVGADTDRRSGALSEKDLEKIGSVFDKKMDQLFEMIGYDTSTHESRSNIRKDHEFVRWARRAKGRLVGAFLAGVGGSCALWFASFFGIGKGHGP